MKPFIFRFFSVLILVSLLLAGQGARPVYAASYVVTSLADDTNNDGSCTLREAILAANNSVGSNDCGSGSNANDTITFSVSGTITLSSTLPNIVSGQGALTIDGGGVITISGGGSVRVMWVNTGADLTLRNLTITGGSAAGGGGIYNFGALTVANSTVSNNIASTGAGILNSGGTLTVTNSTFSGNSAARRGGGITSSSSGALTISNTLFENNTAAGPVSFDGGGAIHATHDVTIQNSTFRGNQYTGDSHGGGAIFFLGGALDITGSTFENNRAGGDGGGAIAAAQDFFSPYVQIRASLFRNNQTLGDFGDGGALNINGDLDIIESTFDSNAANGSDSFGSGDGGGISIINGALLAENVTLTGNRANGNGGGIYYRADSSGLARNVTIAANVADADSNGVGSGGGIYSTGDGSGSDIALENALLAGNSANSGPDCSGFMDSGVGHNLIQTPAGCTLGGITTGNITGQNPNLGPLANNGGPAPTRALLAGSPAIDAGDPGASCPPADQRGVARFDGNYDSVVRCDIGAYEFNQPAPPPVNEPEATPAVLPNTGFAPGRVTHLPAQPLNAAYQSYNDLTLELPTLKVSAPIVGVLKSDGGWDVSWLGNSVGWLEGSAFPTWKGNTVLTSHVWDADNTPGVFAEIKKLKYGDRFYIHAFGQTYVYEVRENTRLWGSNRVDKAFKSEEYDWVTLLTCEGYNPLSGDYLFRRIVRAVLVEVK